MRATEHRYKENVARLRATDIALFSFNRSGNTWMRICLAEIIAELHGLDTSNGFDYGLIIPTLAKHDFDLVAKCNPLPYVIFKTHRHWDVGNRAFVYFFRTPIDALRSYYRATYRGLSIEGAPAFEEYVLDVLPKWKSNIQEALRKRQEGARCIFLKYETFRNEPVATLARICRFLRIECNEPVIRRAVENNEIERLRRRLIAEGNPEVEHMVGEGMPGLGKKLARAETVSWAARKTDTVLAVLDEHASTDWELW